MFPLNKNTTDGTDKFVTTYYVRDPQGNVLAVYEHKHGDSGNGTFTLTEQHLYGTGRLGMKKRDLALNVANASEPTPVTHYELTNHLGNVMAVISDKASDTNEPTVVSLSDYYPYGMTEPGRSWNSGDYRFGYTGHEKEEDLASGVYTTEYRLLDTRLGRWLSVDPLFGKYPGMSSYNYCAGNPVMLVDPDGRVIIVPKEYQKQFLADLQKVFTNQTKHFSFDANGVLQLDESYTKFKEVFTTSYQRNAASGFVDLMKKEDEWTFKYEEYYNNINVKEEQGGALTDMDNHIVVISPNVSGVYVNLDDQSKLGEKEYVEQNTASVLFHEIGEILTPRKKTRRGNVVDYENSARSAIGLPKRPYDFQHSTWCETKDKSYDQVKAENEEIKTKNEESKTKNED